MKHWHKGDCSCCNRFRKALERLDMLVAISDGPKTDREKESRRIIDEALGK